MTNTTRVSVQQTIQEKLRAGLDAQVLEVTNESGQHNVAPGSQTHFRVLAVSSDFVDTNRLGRHRKIHTILADELAGPIHALAIDAWTPAEWQQRGQPSTSPQCRGGSKA